METQMASPLDSVERGGLELEERDSQVRRRSWDFMALHYNSNKPGNRHGEAVWLEEAKTR